MAFETLVSRMAHPFSFAFNATEGMITLPAEKLFIPQGS
jgi:hypothetical protein